MNHKCKKCGTEREIHEFRRKNAEGPWEPWNLRECKACVHQEYLVRYGTPERNAAQKRASSKWKENNPGKHAELNAKWYQANKDKARSGAVLRYAVAKGKIKRQPCEVCGICHRVQGHHDSYAKGAELDVRWLCQDHHKAWHIVLLEQGSEGNIDERFKAFLISIRKE